MRFLLLLFLFSLMACTNGQTLRSMRQQTDSVAVEEEVVIEEVEIDSVALHLESRKDHNYSGMKNQLALRKTYWAGRLKASNDSASKAQVLDSAGMELEDYLIRGLFPFWYGTAWDFNGISNVPGEGQIACGYFVSTTLKHAGFNLNRYRVAQQSAKRACEIFAQTEKVWRIAPTDVEDFKTKTKALPDGLYCVGLDYHVGFLLIRNRQYFFIHSSYFGTDGVSFEKAEESMAFYSQVYYLSAISTNRSLIETWLNGSFISH